MQSSLRSISFGVSRMETVREISGKKVQARAKRRKINALSLRIFTRYFNMAAGCYILVHVCVLCVCHGKKRARAKPTTACGKNALNEHDNVPFSCWYFCWLRFFALSGGLFEYTTGVCVCVWVYLCSVVNFQWAVFSKATYHWCGVVQPKHIGVNNETDSKYCNRDSGATFFCLCMHS